MDITGAVRLADGTRPSIVTGIDDHSRFCVCALVVARATAKPTCDALSLAMRRYGIPEAILTDNGKLFTNRLGHRPPIDPGPIGRHQTRRLPAVDVCIACLVRRPGREAIRNRSDTLCHAIRLCPWANVRSGHHASLELVAHVEPGQET